MTDDFEDHCWQDVIAPDILKVYACYQRKVFVGPNPALLAVDLYELVYRGGPELPAKLAKSFPNACGEYAYAAIEPTKRLFAVARTQPDVLSPQMISVCTPSWVRCAVSGVPKNTLARCLVITTSPACGLNSGRMA